MGYGMEISRNILVYCLIFVLLVSLPAFAIDYAATTAPTSLNLEWGQSSNVITRVTNNNFWYSINCQSSLDGSSWTSVVRINTGQTGSIPMTITAPTSGVATISIGVITRCVSDDKSDSPATFTRYVSLTYPTQEQLNAYNSLNSASSSIND